MCSNYPLLENKYKDLPIEDVFCCLLLFGVLLQFVLCHHHCQSHPEQKRNKQFPLICIYIQRNVHIYPHTDAYTVQEKYLLNKAKTLAADGIHQVHFTIGGNFSGFAGNKRKEINCSNLSTSCLNLFCEILKQMCCSYSHVVTVRTRAFIIRFQFYF